MARIGRVEGVGRDRDGLRYGVAAFAGLPHRGWAARRQRLPAAEPRRAPLGATVVHGGRALTVLSASFVSASAGWLLATPCADQVQTCRTVVVRKTVDGGRTWSAVHAPDVPPADIFQGSPPANAVGTILFTSARTGWAFGPALWQTRDGGLTWRKMRGPGGPVLDLSVAGDRALAVTGRCGVDYPACSFRVYSAAAGSDDWRAILGAVGTGRQLGPPRGVRWRRVRIRRDG